MIADCPGLSDFDHSMFRLRDDTTRLQIHAKLLQSLVVDGVETESQRRLDIQRPVIDEDRVRISARITDPESTLASMRARAPKASSRRQLSAASAIPPSRLQAAMAGRVFR